MKYCSRQNNYPGNASSDRCIKYMGFNVVISDFAIPQSFHFGFVDVGGPHSDQH